MRVLQRLRENLFLRTLLVAAVVGVLVIGGVTYALRGRINASIHQDAMREASAIAVYPIMDGVNVISGSSYLLWRAEGQGKHRLQGVMQPGNVGGIE